MSGAKGAAAIFGLVVKPTILSLLWVGGAVGVGTLPAPFGGLGALAVGLFFLKVHHLWPGRGNRPSVEEVGLGHAPAHGLWLVRTAIATLSLTFGILLLLSEPGADGDEASTLLKRSSPLVICLVGPFIEEVAFRGWLLRRLHRRKGRIVAVSVSALVFALIHFNAEGFAVLALLGV
ncbi:MAG TPA: type II CAAX endopeptidase family protein [Polyangia bacterium]